MHRMRHARVSCCSSERTPLRTDPNIAFVPERPHHLLVSKIPWGVSCNGHDFGAHSPRLRLHDAAGCKSRSWISSWRTSSPQLSNTHITNSQPRRSGGRLHGFHAHGFVVWSFASTQPLRLEGPPCSSCWFSSITCTARASEVLACDSKSSALRSLLGGTSLLAITATAAWEGGRGRVLGIGGIEHDPRCCDTIHAALIN